MLSKINGKSAHLETDCYVVSEQWNKEKPSRSKPPPKKKKSCTKEEVMMANFSIANWTLKIVEHYLQNAKEKSLFIYNKYSSQQNITKFQGKDNFRGMGTHSHFLLTYQFLGHSWRMISGKLE